MSLVRGGFVWKFSCHSHIPIQTTHCPNHRHDQHAPKTNRSVETDDFDYNKVGQSPIDPSAIIVSGGLTDNDETASKSASVANYSDSDIQIEEDQFVIYAPAGKLGLVVDNPDDGPPVVHAIKEDSVLADQVQVGDRLVGVDEVDVRSLSPVKVSKLISKRSTNPLRKLTLTRAKKPRTEDGESQGGTTNGSTASMPLDDKSSEFSEGVSANRDDQSSHVGTMSQLSGMDDPMDDDDESVELTDASGSHADDEAIPGDKKQQGHRPRVDKSKDP